MAYYTDPNEEKDDNSQGMNATEDQSQQVKLSSPTSTMSAPSTGTASKGPAPVGAPKPASSGQTGFQNYTKANQGNAQNKLNASVAQNVANTGTAATNAINQATTKFGQKVDQGSLANRQQALQDVSNTLNSARNLTAGANVDQSQQDRFKEVINSKYQGPESLRQSGLYNQASGKVQNAQTALDNTKTATGREELLKNMYQQRGDYTSGLNKLDSALLNASKQGVQNLQNVAQQQGNIGQKLDRAQVDSANLAQNRTKEIQNIQEQARKAFTENKTAEEKATDERLSKVVENWEQLPEYFRNIIRNSKTDNAAAIKQAQAELAAAQSMKVPLGSNRVGSSSYGAAKRKADAIAAAQAKLNGLQTAQANPNSTNLNSLEAELLGVQSGEGLYRLGADAIKSGVADKTRLISKDEQARQAALSALAGLDLSNRLDTNLLYQNADLAGTQSATDALDLAATRAGLNAAEKNFQNFAKGANITGTGMKKDKSSGKKYYASEKANLGNVLKNAGYNFGQTGTENNIGNKDLLNALARSTTGEMVGGSPSGGVSGAMSSTTDGLEMGGSTPARDYMDLVGSFTGVNALTGAMGLGSATDAYLNLQKYNPAFAPVNAIGNMLGMGDVASNAFNSVFGSGGNAKRSKGIANQLAQQDLQNKVTGALNAQGYGNRVNVVDNDQTTQRAEALRQLLANMDKTNT